MRHGTAEWATTIARPASALRLVEAEMPDLAQEARSRSLKCLSSGYLLDGCSCQAAVPASVVQKAWEACLRRCPWRQDGFFRFHWQCEVWLAYGLTGGEVRGVYCPEHRARRAVCRAAMGLPVDDRPEAA
jgi:hypothetical protein